ncbi:hypothetical protein [Paenibacillus protaetiae]|uniref:hypothetical protein n=1 Tax=Paenibacillus protaetiae TaxID=2509456 RepID=UPI0013EBD220|nr:hypothetical protein [Paenibacillus protaetiae]
MDTNQSKNNQSFLFQVELLVEDADHKAALERLIHKLNQARFEDYRIISGSI